MEQASTQQTTAVQSLEEALYDSGVEVGSVEKVLAVIQPHLQSEQDKALIGAVLEIFAGYRS
jgi:hypothetical protein